jgi:hypothetical protein
VSRVAQPAAAISASTFARDASTPFGEGGGVIRGLGRSDFVRIEI